MKEETTATKQSYQKVSGYVDVGLRSYMLKVFSYMSVGLGLTAGVALFVSMSPTLMKLIFAAPMIFWGLSLASFGLAIYLMARINTLPPATAKMYFFTYAGLLGISLSSIFLMYSTVSIASAFFAASSMFLGMVIYGYTTGRDLTNFGSFLFMGLIGLIVASIINIFTRSPIMDLVISAIGVIIFTGLTAYDTQVIKSYYLESDESDVRERKAIMGALKLYLDFINLFLYLLRFLNSTRSR